MEKKESLDVSFEKSIEKLQETVSQLESGSLGLEESLKMYEEGVSIVKKCQDHLNRAKERVEILSRVSETGSPEFQSFSTK